MYTFLILHNLVCFDVEQWNVIIHKNLPAVGYDVFKIFCFFMVIFFKVYNSFIL